MKGFPSGTSVKNPPANAGDIRDTGSIPGLGRSLVGGHGNPLSILAWRLQWIKDPGRYSPQGHRESDTNEVT